MKNYRHLGHEDREMLLEKRFEAIRREMLDAVEERYEYEEFIDWKIAHEDEIEELRGECEQEMEYGRWSREGNSYGLSEVTEELDKWHSQIFRDTCARRKAARGGKEEERLLILVRILPVSVCQPSLELE